MGLEKGFKGTWVRCICDSGTTLASNFQDDIDGDLPKVHMHPPSQSETYFLGPLQVVI